MVSIEFDSARQRAAVFADGNLFTEYRWGHAVCRPFFYPVQTPDGHSLTRHFPMQTIDGEDHDHFHHRSVYVAHGDVNGCDLWGEGTGHGAMLQRGEPVAGCVDGVAVIDGMVDWYNDVGDALLAERRTIRIWTSGACVITDHRSELRATHGEVTFGDTKEGGLLAIRVPSTMNAAHSGRIENANGEVFDSGQGEEVTWGRRAAWVDYSGPLANGEQWGHTVVDHPANPRYPTYWHVRGYGLFTANPFGVHHFEKDDALDGSLTLEAGQQVVFRYRWIVHPGRGIDASVRQLIESWLDA